MPQDRLEQKLQQPAGKRWPPARFFNTPSLETKHHDKLLMLGEMMAAPFTFSILYICHVLYMCSSLTFLYHPIRAEKRTD